MPTSSERYEATLANMGTVCLVMPLRLGVFLIACSTFVLSLVFFLDLVWWDAFDDFSRKFTGGYQRRSRLVVGAMEISGILFGFVGALGVWYAKWKWVVAYNIWQLLRIAVWAFMYVLDIPLLIHCEDWVNNVQSASDGREWNQLMYSIAMAGNCHGEQIWFFLCSICCVLTFMYLALATFKYQQRLEWIPKHLLRLTKDTGDSAFCTEGYGHRNVGHPRDPACPVPFQTQVAGPSAPGSAPPSVAAPPSGPMLPGSLPPPATRDSMAGGFVPQTVLGGPPPGYGAV